MMNVPKKFVSLHNHTGASANDGLGGVDDHFKWCMENGLDCHAVTEHGHMNSFAVAYLMMEKWKKEGKKFKYIPGVESYFHPDLKQWQSDKVIAEQAALDKKVAKKLASKQEQLATKLITVTDENDETLDIEMSNALTIENEDETKSTKHFNPVNRRHHLVLLPKTSRGLQKLFLLVSKSYIDGFYRFPRIDARWLREAALDGEIIASSACLGGPCAWWIFQELQKIPFDELSQSLLDDKLLLEKCVNAVANSYDLLSNAVGKENFYLELQFNRLPAQNLVNRAIIEFANRNNLNDKMIVTCDAHYARPEFWKERELYKKLGFMNYMNFSPDSLPKSKDELKCELYPKNAQQVWDEYLRSKQGTSFYDDGLIKAAIERTHDIAHEIIGDVTFDKSYKYPSNIIPKGKTSFQVLCELAKTGIIKRNLADKQEYVDRLKHELEIIKKLDNASYFVTLARALELAREVCLLGVARGSSGGSLVAYVLGITDLDPIKYKCRFDRFMSIHRSGAPDIDVDVANRDAVLEKLREEFGYTNVIPISNINTFKLKTLVKDLAKFHGIPFEEANAATKTVEFDVRKAVMKHGDDKNLFTLRYNDAMGFYCSVNKENPICSGCSLNCDKPVSPSFRTFIEKHPEISHSITILFKEQRSLGRHAGGVCIMNDAMSEMPLIASSGEPQTPWCEGVSIKTLEPLGVIKYDLLGLETMRLIERTIEMIIEKKGLVEIEIENQKYRIPADKRVKLTNGSLRSVAELKVDDDVIIPLEFEN